MKTINLIILTEQWEIFFSLLFIAKYKTRLFLIVFFMKEFELLEKKEYIYIYIYRERERERERRNKKKTER